MNTLVKQDIVLDVTEHAGSSTVFVCLRSHWNTILMHAIMWKVHGNLFIFLSNANRFQLKMLPKVL